MAPSDRPFLNSLCERDIDLLRFELMKSRAHSPSSKNQPRFFKICAPLPAVLQDPVRNRRRSTPPGSSSDWLTHDSQRADWDAALKRRSTPGAWIETKTELSALCHRKAQQSSAEAAGSEGRRRSEVGGGPVGARYWRQFGHVHHSGSGSTSCSRQHTGTEPSLYSDQLAASSGCREAQVCREYKTLKMRLVS